jgi:hypothetical protein
MRAAVLALLPDRCCAHARSTGLPCAAKAMKNGRCKNHGGMATGAKTQEGRERISASNRRRWQAWRAANGRQVRATGDPAQDRLLDLLASLSPTDRFLHDAQKPAVTPWTTTIPRPETRPVQEIKRKPSVDVVEMVEQYPDRSYERPRQTYADVSPSTARRMRGR